MYFRLYFFPKIVNREVVKKQYLLIILGYFFLFLHKNIYFEYLLAAPQRGYFVCHNKSCTEIMFLICDIIKIKLVYL